MAPLALFSRVSPVQETCFFYEIVAGEVVIRRAMHGHRDLPRRLLEPPKPD